MAAEGKEELALTSSACIAIWSVWSEFLSYFALLCCLKYPGSKREFQKHLELANHKEVYPSLTRIHSSAICAVSLWFVPAIAKHCKTLILFAGMACSKPWCH